MNAPTSRSELSTKLAPKVSIVMPCFNASAHLARSVGSVQAQQFEDWELIVVDDGSADDTWQSLNRIAQGDERIRPIRQSNAGASAARNRGLSHVRGDYVAFLDADDTWDAGFLGAMWGALESHPSAGLAYCGWQNIGLGGGRDRPFMPPEYENSQKLENLLRSCLWPIHAAMVRADLLRDSGGFDTRLRTAEDFHLWLRLGVKNRLVRVPVVLAYYHHHSASQLTSDRGRMALDHWCAQRWYLSSNPEMAIDLGRRRLRECTVGELLQRGYEAYWRRDLPAARAIFRTVMRQGYGTWKDWIRMLPAWLPQRWHRWLVDQRDGSAEASRST